MMFTRKNYTLTGKMLGLLVTGSGLLASGSLYAQSSGSMMVDVGPCIRLESAIQRFACYEQQVENTLTGTTTAYEPLVVPGTASRPAPAAPAPISATPPTAPATTMPPPSAPTVAAPAAAAVAVASDPEASFGLQEERKRDDEIEELYSTVTELKETVPNAYMITLANGQVWRQVRPDARYRLKVGHEVRIYPSRWGNDFRLSATDLRGFIQVERVQ